MLSVYDKWYSVIIELYEIKSPLQTLPEMKINVILMDIENYYLRGTK